MRRFTKSKHVEKSKSSLKTDVGEIPYTLSRSTARRTLAITVDERAKVSIASPFRMKEREINDFIHDKAQWIVARIKEAKINKAIIDGKTYEDGKYFLFLGKKFRLSVFKRNVKRGHIAFSELDGWFVTIPRDISAQKGRDLVKQKMLRWYRREAEEILGSRIYHYSRIMNVEPKKIAVRTQKRIWGCCDYNTQTINLNWQIILSPLRVIDYVVVHEMCHLTIPNHSKRFWNKVEKFMPDFKRYKEWLGANHLDMVLP